jgi:hypothetical protein
LIPQLAIKREDTILVIQAIILFHSFDLGESISFSGTITHGTPPFQYQWISSVDGVIGTQASINFDGLSLGPHVISWRVRDNQGFIAEAKVRIHIGNNIEFWDVK